MKPSTRSFLLALALSAVFASPGFAAESSEESLAIPEVPEAVRGAVRSRFPGAPLLEASRETDEGRLLYEVSLKEKGRHVDVMVTPEGQIVLIEREIRVKEVPDAVRKAVLDAHPGARLRAGEEILEVRDGEEALAYYEVVATAPGKKSWEIKLTPAGRIVEEEGGSGEDGSEDDDD